jgi:hypothetical protein
MLSSVKARAEWISLLPVLSITHFIGNLLRAFKSRKRVNADEQHHQAFL